MNMRKRPGFPHAVLILAVFALAGTVLGQPSGFTPPETVLPPRWIHALLNEISGQLAFNNMVMMAGYNHIRTDEEFETFFYEAEYLARKLREYGIDEVRLEDLADKDGPGGWWVRQDAELWMVEPETRRLSRLVEHPALMARMTDTGEWEGELVYLDQRDIRDLDGKDFSGKIILTPLNPGYLVKALENGALGIVSYWSHAKDSTDPYQVIFNMRFNKGRIDRPAFGFQIWRHLGEQLRDRLYRGEKIVLRAVAKGKNIPHKLDTVFAVVRGTRPEKKGLMFTAHLFERPAKQGANDNVSGCVTLAEIARTLTALIAEGRIERPERNIYFLMGEEGGGTMAFFKRYPEMVEKILGVINMDMVGEDLEMHSAFFNIERSITSKPTFLDSAAVNAAHYVFETNIERYSHGSRETYVDFPVPIVEKNGSKQPFRFLTSEHVGGSDHSVFIESDAGIPALSFNCWPDIWYHTDKDRPDKSDPTQLKRVAFIGAFAALAVCSGDDEILENLIRISGQEKAALIRDSLNRAMNRVAELRTGDGGEMYGFALNTVEQAAQVHKQALSGIGELTRGKDRLEAYLENVLRDLDALQGHAVDALASHYRSIAALRGFSPDIAEPSREEMRLKDVTPEKIQPVILGDRFPYQRLFDSIRNHSELLDKMNRVYGYQMLMQLFFAVDGEKSLADIRNLMSFTHAPVPVDDFMSIVECLKDAELIRY